MFYLFIKKGLVVFISFLLYLLFICLIDFYSFSFVHL